MNRIYSDAKDLHVETTLVYLDGNNLYKDYNFTKPLTMVEAADLYVKGMTIVESNGSYATPCRMMGNPDWIKINYFTSDGNMTYATTTDSESSLPQ